jgi:hypothetical protein
MEKISHRAGLFFCPISENAEHLDVNDLYVGIHTSYVE